MSDPFDVVRDFEAALSAYTGAPYAVAVTSCTMALLLTCRYALDAFPAPHINIPKLTYVGVPMSIIHAGSKPEFRDEDWQGEYQLRPFLVYDAARRFTSGMYHGGYQCVSFHHTKILGISTHGGAILHGSKAADRWFKRARFDGRTEGVAPKQDTFDMLGWHCYMTPATAAEGLQRLACLPAHNPDLSRSDYADLSQVELFK